MFRTTQMRLMELMILHQDIDRVLEYLGKNANFQIQNDTDYSGTQENNTNREILEKLQACRNYLGIPDVDDFCGVTSLPSETDFDKANSLCSSVENMRARESEVTDRHKRVSNAYDEALAFANLKVPYSEIDHLTFLTIRIGKIDPTVIEDLQFSVGDRAVIVPLGEDQTRILAAASKKGRFALDTELKRFNFVSLEIPKDFKGVPDEVLNSLKTQVEVNSRDADAIVAERQKYAEIHRDELINLLQTFSLASQVREVRESLESTQLVYRITGWIAADDSHTLMKDLDELTEGRVAIRVYLPNEIPSIQDGREKVPVQYKHNALIKSFERMIFSYGAPLYGTIDPTPIVAFFYTLLFGIMFGDVGQGGFFLLLGLALVSGRFKKLQRWQHFGLVFVSIGCASMIMGLLTGEFFTNGDLFKPFSRWVTGLFGEPRDRILELMPTKGALDKLLIFFGFTLAVGFIINSIGLVINIVNQFSLGHPEKAIFSKIGICGAFFFWYVVFAVIRILGTSSSIRWFDIVCVVIPLIGLFFADPLSRLVTRQHPIFENGIFSAFIEGVVEILETVSTYISNSVSFLRVGAFALSHAVLSYIVFTMSGLVGGSLSAGGLVIGIFGNAVIIVLEGLIVAIQVIRLQYYEFFSKFFVETGREFKPFRFKYKEN